MLDACEDTIHQSAGGNMGIEPDTHRASVGPSIISVVRTCFEGLTDPVHSLETRRLMLHNYQIATKLLRSALAVNATDRSLAVPIRALALYEVRCEHFCLKYYPG